MRRRRSPYDLDSWWDTKTGLWLKRVTVCRVLGHKWRQKMYARYCERCGR